MNKIALEQIDLSTHEGRLLQAALIELTVTVHRDKTPYQVIDHLYERALLTDEANKKGGWPEIQKGNVYAQLDRLAKFMLREVPGTIHEGGAVDNAIRLLKTAYSDLSLKRQKGNDCCVASSTPFADAIKKAVNQDEQTKQAGLFEIQKAGEVILSKAVCLPSCEYQEIKRLLVGLYRIISGK